MFQHVFFGYTIIPLPKAAGNLFHRMAPGVKIVKVNSDKIQDLSGSSTCFSWKFSTPQFIEEIVGDIIERKKTPCDFGAFWKVFNLGQHPEIKGKSVFISFIVGSGIGKCM